MGNWLMQSLSPHAVWKLRLAKLATIRFTFRMYYVMLDCMFCFTKHQ